MESPSEGGVPVEDDAPEKPQTAVVAEKRSGCSHYKRRAKFVVSIVMDVYYKYKQWPLHVHDFFVFVSDRLSIVCFIRAVLTQFALQLCANDLNNCTFLIQCGDKLNGQYSNQLTYHKKIRKFPKKN